MLHWITHAINWLIQQAANIVGALLSILPDSPLHYVQQHLGPYLGIINYFLPINGMVAEMEVLLPAVLIWYGVRWILRMMRYAGG